MDLEKVISELRAEQALLERAIAHLEKLYQDTREVLFSGVVKKRRGRPKKTEEPTR